MTTERRPVPTTCALGLALLLAATPSLAQTWNYKAYPRDRNGLYDKNRFLTGTISFKEEKDGKGLFRMIIASSRPDPCTAASDVPAEVERTPDTVTITVLPTLQGCESFRYVLKADGSGGVRMYRRNDEWKPDGFDHDLTLAK